MLRIVQLRPTESVNPKIATGDIEVKANVLEVINKTNPLPFDYCSNKGVSQELRLKYRYLDLRNKESIENFEFRSRLFLFIRNFLVKRDFIEVETPILTKYIPGGARNFLVPSRHFEKCYYALAESPQVFKQLLMIAGFDKYFQIAKCLRDEDLRADRQPEFTQIDVEMSFVTQEDIFELSEGLFKEIWKKILNVDIKIPFNRFTYDEVLNKYGTDKPDLRIKNDLTIKNLTDIFKNSNFNIFKSAIESNGFIAGIKLKTKEYKIEITRKIIDNYTEFVKKSGVGGLVYIKSDETGKISSPILKINFRFI